MSSDADGLREVFETVAGEAELVEEQREEIDHTVEERDENDAVAHAIDDGLDGAIEGQESGGASAPSE